MSSRLTMRRFHQVAVVALALLSLIAFLVYKHEYERLRNVLEVLNTFGQHPAASTGRTSAGHHLHAWTSDHPCPDVGVNWRQFDDGVHVFTTAFWNRGQSIVAHGVIRGHRRRRPVDTWTRCHVRLDTASSSSTSADATLEVDGEVTDDDVWSSFTLMCKYRALTLPVAVAFSSSASATSMTPMIDVYRTTNLTPPANDVAICGSSIFDPTTSTDESVVVQFLEYHRRVAVTRIVIYVDNLLPSVRRRIQIAASARHDDLIVRLVDWNAPVSDDSIGAATSIVMKRDCVSRLRSETRYVAFLDLHELLVSRYHSRLSNFVKDEADAVDGKLGGLRLDRRIFCTEFDDGPNGLPETESFVFRYKNDLVTTPPMFTKTRWIGEDVLAGRNGTYLLEIESAFGTSSFPNSGRNFPKVSDKFACVHAYVPCGANYKRLVGHANSDDVVVKRMHDQFL